MIDAAEEAQGFASGRTVEDIRNDRALALVLVKCLEMMGEAAFKVSRNYRDTHPDVPWTHLIQLRNHLVHEYHDIDVERVWSTLQSELPSILTDLRRLIAHFPSN
jgi:Uncharacterized conserved protein